MKREDIEYDIEDYSAILKELHKLITDKQYLEHIAEARYEIHPELYEYIESYVLTATKELFSPENLAKLTSLKMYQAIGQYILASTKLGIEIGIAITKANEEHNRKIREGK